MAEGIVPGQGAAFRKAVSRPEIYSLLRRLKRTDMTAPNENKREQKENNQVSVIKLTKKSASGARFIGGNLAEKTLKKLLTNPCHRVSI